MPLKGKILLICLLPPLHPFPCCKAYFSFLGLQPTTAGRTWGERRKCRRGPEVALTANSRVTGCPASTGRAALITGVWICEPDGGVRAQPRPGVRGTRCGWKSSPLGNGGTCLPRTDAGKVVGRGREVRGQGSANPTPGQEKQATQARWGARRGRGPGAACAHKRGPSWGCHAGRPGPGAAGVAEGPPRAVTPRRALRSGVSGPPAAARGRTAAGAGGAHFGGGAGRGRQRAFAPDAGDPPGPAPPTAFL